MKELIFRAWDYDDNKMLYFGGIFNRQPYTETSTFVQYESCPKYHRLSDIEMWTGLIDKNGLKIYEGDIVYTYTSTDLRREIIFQSGAFGWMQEDYESEEMKFEPIWDSDLTIVGNVHEKEGE